MKLVITLTSGKQVEICHLTEDEAHDALEGVPPALAAACHGQLSTPFTDRPQAVHCRGVHLPGRPLGDPQ